MRSRSIRKTKLVNGLQLRLIAAFLGMGVVAAGFQAVLTSRSLMQLGQEMQVDAELLLASAPRMLVTDALVTLAVLVPMMLAFGVLATHRIAGPIRRFEDYLADVVNDEAFGPCEIRRTDELQELCTRLNEAVYHLNARAERGSAPAPPAPPRRLDPAAEEDSPWVEVLDAAA